MHRRPLSWLAPSAALIALLLTGLAPPLRAADRVLSGAARCYAAGDMACVLQRLESTASEAPERWRMLAFAAARLDRAALSRQAFAAWIGSSPSHRLERQSTAPTVWRHYAAALLQVHGGKLDLTPRVQPPAVLPPGAVTGVTLPRFPPPPRSKRDDNRDFALCLGLPLGLPLDRAGLAPGLRLLLGLHLSPVWRAALEVGGLRYPDGGDGLGGDPPGTLIQAAVRADLLWLQGAAGELGFGLAAGGGQLNWDDGTGSAVAAVRPLLRYAWPARRQGGGLAIWAELAHQLLWAGDGSQHVPSLALGVELRPGAGGRSPRSPRPGR